MPAKVKVRILAGRNLPVMDRASDTSDAYVEVKLGNTTYKTEVCRRSLNPQWNSEWFKFEVDDEELQDEPLQIRIMDYDTYSANDAIGKVYIDLNPLLNKETGPLMSGWFPIFDTMHGLRGEVNAVVKVDLFSDSNKYRESSCGVLFFYSQGVPYGYKAQEILGFVEELVVNDDPEYQWIDKIRTPRASNEARQTLFSKLSGAVQRKIGLKALELGGNAVISYHQYFDLEGESGIVVRGIGTAVRLVRLVEGMVQAHQTMSPPRDPLRESPVAEDFNSNVQGSVSPKNQQSPAKTVAGVNIGMGTRRSSDPDLSTPPKGSGMAGLSGGKVPAHRPALNQESLDMLEYPFITMKSFPAHVIQHLGGVVSARSVKLLDQINNPDDPETRDAWWTELRKEIRSHTRALGCNVVLGYTETTSFCDDICVLSSSGTAAVLSQSVDHESSGVSPVVIGYPSTSSRPTSGDRVDKETPKENKNKPLSIDVNLANHPTRQLTDWTDDILNSQVCSLCHIPYSESSVPFSANLVQCAICRRSKVPDVLFMTIEPPPGIPITGKGCFIQSRVFRMKRDSKGEQNAKDISDSLPFLEYELHKQLLTKLKVKGMNGLFGLRVQVSIGERMLIGVATGTGAYLSSLPPPSIPKITCAKGTDEARLCEIQKLVHETVTRNKESYDLMFTIPEIVPEPQTNGKVEDCETSEDDLPEIDLSMGNKDTFILEVDDSDVDILSLLNDPKPPDGFELCNTEKLPGVNNFVCNIQMFTRVYRTKLTCLGQSSRQVTQHFEYFLQSLFVKLRRMMPCCISCLYFNVEIPEQDEMQVSAYGVAVGLGDPNLLSAITGRVAKHRVKHNSLPHVGPESDSDLLFSIDDEKQAGPSQAPQEKSGIQLQLFQRPTLFFLPHRRRSSLKSQTGMTMSQSAEGRFQYHSPFREQSGIELSPLSFIPGGRIEHYLGNLDFFFIRECTSIRENGGLNGFIQSFISEVLAIVRAHVAALGGNALVAFQMTHCILLYNPHKNQAQCLVNVAGDAVSVLYSTLHHSSGSETQYSEGE